MELKIFVILVCCAYAVLARETYYNGSAHALKVYGHSYYNPMTGEPLDGLIEDERLPFGTQKVMFRGLPCSCVDTHCGCCAGLNISAIKFDRRYCANFTFDPSLFEFDMHVLMNENEIFQTTVSARNPPPICVPLPYVPVLNFCLRFYDLSYEDRNLKTCIDFETRLVQSPLLIMHFDCLRIGDEGISWIRPNEEIALTPPAPEQQSADIFDPVDFENATEISDGFALDDIGTTLSPEEEDKIGQHRIP